MVKRTEGSPNFAASLTVAPGRIRNGRNRTGRVGLGVGCGMCGRGVALGSAPPPHGSVWGQDIPNVSGLQSLNRLH